MKVTCPTGSQPSRTQRESYFTSSHWGSCWVHRVCVGSIEVGVGSARLFKHQHVDIGNAELGV